MKVNCTKCGNHIPDGAKFCPSCGEPVQSQEEKRETPGQESQVNQAILSAQNLPTKTKKPIYKRVWFWALAVVAIIIVAIALTPAPNNADDSNTGSSQSNPELASADSGEENNAAKEKKPESKPEPKKTPEQIAQEKEEYKAGCAAVPYNTLARDPDSNMQKNIKFYGQVIQVLDDGAGGVTLRVSTKNSGYGYYDDVILVVYTYSDGELKILEKDMVSVFGLSGGLYTYDTAMGSKMTVPIVYATYVDVES